MKTLNVDFFYIPQLFCIVLKKQYVSKERNNVLVYGSL